MNGKLLLCAALIGGSVCSWYASAHPEVLASVQTWFQVHIGGADPTYSVDRFEVEVVDRINHQRREAKLPPANFDNELRKWLVASSPQINLDNLDAVLAMMETQQPRYYPVHVSSARDKSMRTLVERLESSAATEPTSSHVAVLSRQQSSGYGYEALLVIGQRLSNFNPEAMNAHNNDTFFAICPHCKTSHVCKVSLAQRTVNLECPSCKKDYGVLAPDEQGRYRWANEYLTGYEPPTRYSDEDSRLHELFAIWNAVVSTITYTKDGTPACPNRDAWQTPLETMVRGKGDCEDTALLLADWLLARGFDARVAIGRYGDMGQHAWVVVRVENVEYLLESTEGTPNIEKPPFVSDVGQRYVPETLFDRENLYVRAKPHDRFSNVYWSQKDWIRVRPQQMFDEEKKPGSRLAGNEIKTTSPRPVATSARPPRKDPAAVPMPPFSRLKELAPGVKRWQLQAAPR
jgi:predicted transglutaminase-like cysteine proteinase